MNGRRSLLVNEHVQPFSSKSLSLGVTAIFIYGTMCGSGILALPKALVDSGWGGIVLLILCGIISSYTGTLLGNCWTIVKQRYPEYDNQHTADPYPTIGFRAAGMWGERVTRACIIITLFGGGVVYILLIAGNMDKLIQSLGHESLYECFLVLIVGGFLIPFSWLGTPKDFWQAGILAAVTTTLGGILIVIGLAVMAPYQPPVTHANPSFNSFFTAFGTILFAFGGASIFPTLQVDMKNPDKFPLAVVIGIISVLAMYVSVSVSGFVVLGDNMENTNILKNMTPNWILYTVIILITSHLLLAFLVVINPVAQDIESFLKIANRLSLKRIAVRTSLMLSIIFLALSIPHFGVILSLVGGTTITATNFILPPLFYLLLSRQKSPMHGYFRLPNNSSTDKISSLDKSADVEESGCFSTNDEFPQSQSWTQIEIPLHIKVLLVEIIFLGLVGGISSTYSAILSLVDGSSGFSVPCYMNWATADA